MMTAKPSRSRSGYSIIMLMLAAALMGCYSPKKVNYPERVRYQEVFSPPDTYLDALSLPLNVQDVNIQTVEEAIYIGGREGFDLQFVGAVPSASCVAYCYVFREPLADHVFVVFSVDGAQRRLLNWFTFSQRESGAPPN